MGKGSFFPDHWLHENAFNCLEMFWNLVENKILEGFYIFPDEEYITHLLFQILSDKDFFNEAVEQANSCFAEQILRKSKSDKPSFLHLNCKPVVYKRKEEQIIGADLGVILNINVEGYIIEKVVLFQAKKLYKETKLPKYTLKSTFSALNKEYLKQARSMLDITPESFYLFISPWQVYDLNKKINVGLRVAPATRILMMENYLPLNCKGMLKITTSFTQFMVHDFIACNRGDPREEIIYKIKNDHRLFPYKLLLELSTG
ncbi:MAG: hypothetical protein ACTSSG_07370 [Candidatus Heimdallarchaeaceae archaeon]